MDHSNFLDGNGNDSGGGDMIWLFIVTIIMVSPICYTAIMIEKEYNEFIKRRK